MGFFIGLIIFFIVVWIFIKAFSSNEKVVEVTTIDTETGEKKTEVRKEINNSAGKSAAQFTLFIVIGIPLLLMIIAMIAG